jgi:hypothetical protein
MCIVEFVGFLTFFLNSKSKFFVFGDYLLATYFIFLIICLASLKEITNGCIECHYIAKVYMEDYWVTLVIIISLSLIYFFIIRNLSFYKKK